MKIGRTNSSWTRIRGQSVEADRSRRHDFGIGPSAANAFIRALDGRTGAPVRVGSALGFGEGVALVALLGCCGICDLVSGGTELVMDALSRVDALGARVGLRQLTHFPRNYFLLGSNATRPASPGFLGRSHE